MALYLRIDHVKDYDWLKRIIQNWLDSDPNNIKLQNNFEFIYAWGQYLESNVVTSKEVTESVNKDDLAKILPPTKRQVKKPSSKPVVESPRRGRPPSKQTIAANKKKELADRKQEKLDKIKELASDPFRCVDHPTYHGKNRLSRDCTKCWDIYKSFHPQDWKQVWSAYQRSVKANNNA